MKKHIYFVPGTAANSKIFDRIEFPKDTYDTYCLEWIIPLSKNESITSYAKRLCAKINHEKPILIGVSFGGILVQEMSKIIECEKLVIISSIKTKYELPKRLKLIKQFQFYRLAPIYFVKPMESLIAFMFGSKAKNRIEAYRMYLSQRSPLYLKWAIKQALYWNQETEIEHIIHLHGDQDIIFPVENIQDCVSIKNGSHVMIITKAKKISTILLDRLQ